MLAFDFFEIAVPVLLFVAFFVILWLFWSGTDGAAESVEVLVATKPRPRGRQAHAGERHEFARPTPDG